MKKKFLITFIILIIFAMTACSDLQKNNGDSFINNLKYQYKFIQKNIPTEEETYKLNHRYEDTPFLMEKENKLIITNYDYTSIKSFTILGPDEIGSFVAVDYGEFGKYLCYIGSEDYKVNNVYEINTVANDFYILNDDRSTIYCVSEEKITRIIKVNGKWQKDEGFEIDVGDCIEAFYVENDTVYIATLTKLIKIKDDKIEQILIKNAFWGVLYPNSIVHIDDTLYIGMIGGITSYNLDTGELLWYEQVTTETGT